jgi:hypothetical protein
MSKDSMQLLRDLIDAPACDPSATRRLDLYKFYQERVETIRTRLWTTLTWLAAAQGALLVLAFREGQIRPTTGPSLLIGQPILILVLGVLGMILARYTLNVVDDGTDHIQSNWHSSDFALGREPDGRTLCTAQWRKRFPAFAVMKRLGQLALIPTTAMLFIAVAGTIDWLVWDVPGIHVVAGNLSSGAPAPATQ